MNFQLTGKISLKLDSNSSLLLQYGRKFLYYYYCYQFKLIEPKNKSVQSKIKNLRMKCTNID